MTPKIFKLLYCRGLLTGVDHITTLPGWYLFVSEFEKFDRKFGKFDKKDAYEYNRFIRKYCLL